MAAAGDHLESARADRNLIAMRDAAIGSRQGRDPLQVILAAPEQSVGQALVHAVAAEEQALRLLAFFGAAVLVIDRLQIFDLRHEEWTAEALNHPAGKADVVGMRMRDDEAADLDVLERTFKQRGPG